MKIKSGKAFRRAAQAAPKSAEGARKAPFSSVFIRVHLWLIGFFFLCVLCVSVVIVFLLPTTDQRRPTTAHVFARPSTVVRLPSSFAPDS